MRNLTQEEEHHHVVSPIRRRIPLLESSYGNSSVVGGESSSSSSSSVRHGPLCAALTVLLLIPLAVINYFPTTTTTTTTITNLSSSTTTSNNNNTPNPFRKTKKQHQLPTTTQTSQMKKWMSPMGPYNGIPWKTERTIQTTTLAETPFARCDVHTVRSEDGSQVVDDWLFFEERDAINVAVQSMDGKFILFKQHKYAIKGETLSPVGGFIDDDESPFMAARREVYEELGMGSRVTLQELQSQPPSQSQNGGGGDGNNKPQIPTNNKSGIGYDVSITKQGSFDGSIPLDESADWTFLGSYRIMANRGGGFIYCYLLQNAIPLVEGGGTESFLGEGDDEMQELVWLDEEEVRSVLMDGRFREVKWTVTLSMSLHVLAAQKKEKRGMGEVVKEEEVLEKDGQVNVKQENRVV